jgi:hypothetical protein
VAVADILLPRGGFGDVGQRQVVFDEAFFHGVGRMMSRSMDRVSEAEVMLSEVP